MCTASTCISRLPFMDIMKKVIIDKLNVSWIQIKKYDRWVGDLPILLSILIYNKQTEIVYDLFVCNFLLNVAADQAHAVFNKIWHFWAQLEISHRLQLAVHDRRHTTYFHSTPVLHEYMIHPIEIRWSRQVRN